MKYRINWKEMSRQQKWEHIWEYYRLHILLGLCTVGLGAYFLISAVTYEAPLLSLLMVDSQVTQTEDAFEDFLQSYGYAADAVIACNDSIRFNTASANEGLSYDDYQRYQALYAMVAGGENDLMLSSRDIFLTLADEGCFLDLSQVLPRVLLEQYADLLVYTEEAGDTLPYPCGLVLPDNGWLKETGRYEICWFGIFKNGLNREAAAQFAQYLLDEEGGCGI